MGVRILRAIANRLWYIQPPRLMLIQAAPTLCLLTLHQAVKPSVERLHLRNLFMEGRHYSFAAQELAFRMNSTSRSPWRRRHGRPAAVLLGQCADIGAGITRVDLRTRMSLPFLLDVFVLPGWMSLLLLFGPLPLQTGIIASLVLLLCSWLWHWYNAALQATDLLYFVEVALDDLPDAQVAQLAASTDNTIRADFVEEWQKFYQEHRGA